MLTSAKKRIVDGLGCVLPASSCNCATFLLTSYYVYVFEHLSVFSVNLPVICDYSILTL